ncbi:hypothetical protein CA54_36160 [Symmachiella macrocystis]|uniref:Uncharacterized protein n=1 Tax=Symmachiella macrocystis TaxID=2527985 RepID=A0A5C6BSP9_9PLAN|nr:hypothetical protein [Symmachiella macrocystis]TWU14747.1 hypothetical protein CA54_36160 [Symmachiella macrocystis]
MNATLNRKEYVELVGRGQPDAYPKSTEDVVSELRERGFDARVPALDYLIRKNVVSPPREGRNYQWRTKHVDRAAAVLEEQQCFLPRTWCNIELGISAAQRIRALRIAVWSAIDEFEVELREDESVFVMHVHPPRLSRDGLVEFTLCEDTQRDLETRRGELQTYDRTMMPDEIAWRKRRSKQQ